MEEEGIAEKVYACIYVSVDFLNGTEQKESSQKYRVGLLSTNFCTSTMYYKVQGGRDRTTTDLVTQLICSFHYELYALALVHTWLHFL